MKANATCQLCGVKKAVRCNHCGKRRWCRSCLIDHKMVSRFPDSVPEGYYTKE